MSESVVCVGCGAVILCRRWVYEYLKTLSADGAGEIYCRACAAHMLPGGTLDAGDDVFVIGRVGKGLPRRSVGHRRTR